MSPPNAQPTTCSSSVSLIRAVRPVRPMTLEAEPRSITFDLSRSALVVVDMQNDFCHPDGWFASSGTDIAYAIEVIPAIAQLMASARHHAIPVIHLHWGVCADTLDMSEGQLMFGKRFGARAGYGESIDTGHRVLVRGEWGAAAVEALSPNADDIVVYKSRFSGFWHTELDAVLRRLDVTTLLFAGINTERCVMATLQDASFLGYDVVLMEEAVATPSSDASRLAALTLIRQLYGFTATGCMFTE